MNIVRVISDTHGKYSRYKKIAKCGHPSVQVGDHGVGFVRYGGDRHGEFYQNPPHKFMVENNARFIRGNHDNPKVCKKHSQWIKDGTVENCIMYVGGTISVDKEWRIKDYSWWEDEELSYQELMEIISIYEIAKPEIMLTHDTCTTAAIALCMHKGITYFRDGSRTRNALESCFQIHKPKLWCWGHWHTHFDRVIDGCRFICLNELQWADIDIETCSVLEIGQG